MASLTESGFSARIDNAEKIYVTVSSMGNYAAPGGLDMRALRAVIDATRTANSATATARQTWSLTITRRAKMFYGEPGSIGKLLAQILAHVRSVYGKDAKEYIIISALAQKIRGNKPRSLPKQPDEKTVSQSQRSYGSVLGNFAALIDNLAGLGTNYAPAHQAITVASLQALLASCSAASDQVTADYQVMKTQMTNRDNQYTQLNSLCQRIKDAVKAQYGISSDQSKLIKGLLV